MIGKLDAFFGGSNVCLKSSVAIIPLPMQSRKRVAIVGSGCSGIAALWALKSTNHEVHLYEAKDRLGGHTNTVPFRYGAKIINVDTGFIVMNSATYRQ